MRRFIDVIFAHQKNRYYVVLHQGKFWQLTRMSLTATSWAFRSPYKGSLANIYVAKNQVITDKKLAKILRTHTLPAQLHGLTAERFLDWWQMNDYKWSINQNQSNINTVNETVLSTPTNTPINSPASDNASKTVITPAALAILQKKLFADPISALATQQPPKTPVQPSGTQSKQQKSNTPLPTKKTQSKADENLDVFDTLLKELTDELIHK